MLWTEKYRPQSIKELIASPFVKEKLNEWNDTQEMNNLFLCGIRGRGKTTTATLMAKLLTNDDSDWKLINSPSLKAEDLRNIINHTISTPPKASPYTVLIFEEFDKMSDKLQEILDEELPFISIESWGCVHEDGQEFEQII